MIFKYHLGYTCLINDLKYVICGREHYKYYKNIEVNKNYYFLVHIKEGTRNGDFAYISIIPEDEISIQKAKGGPTL